MGDTMPKILVVEDNEMNRDMLVRRLKRKGFEIEIAEDGQQAIEKTKTYSPDLILMDMRMPVMDGWQATYALKNDPSTKHITIIGLSANAMEGDREKALEAGCDEYDTKPVDFKTLVTKINSMLTKAA